MQWPIDFGEEAVKEELSPNSPEKKSILLPLLTWLRVFVFFQTKLLEISVDFVTSHTITKEVKDVLAFLLFSLK